MIEYLAALVIFGHGIGHITGPLFSYGVKIGGMADKPWILSVKQTMTGRVAKAWSVLWIAALILFVVSSTGAFMGDTWWREWSVIGAAVSMIAMVPWWRSILIGAKAGVLLDVAMLLILPFDWGQRVVDFFGLP